MSLVHTCCLHGANPIDYRSTLIGHSDKIAEEPEHWLPCNHAAGLPSSPAGPRHLTLF